MPKEFARLDVRLDHAVALSTPCMEHAIPQVTEHSTVRSVANVPRRPAEPWNIRLPTLGLAVTVGDVMSSVTLLPRT